MPTKSVERKTRQRIQRGIALTALLAATLAPPLYAEDATPASTRTARSQLLEQVASASYDRKDLQAMVRAVPPSEQSALLGNLTKFMKAPQWSVKATAAYCLGELGPVAAPAVPEMINAMLNSEMSNVAWAVIPALKKIGPAAVPPLKSALATNSKNSKRYHLFEAVTALGPVAKDVAPVVTQELANGPASSEAVKALVAIGPACIPAVINKFPNDRRGHYTHNAAQVLSAFDIKTVTQQLVEFSKKAPQDMQSSIGYVFLNLKNPPDKSASLRLCQMVKEAPAPDPNIEDALKRVGPAATVDVVEILLSSSSLPLQNSAMRLLQSWGPGAKQALPKLTSMLTRKSENTAAVASTILSIDRHNAAAITKLKALLASKDQSERRNAAAQIAASGAGAANFVPQLIKALKDPSPSVRAEAATALGAAGKEAKSAVPALIEAAQSDHPAENYGWEAIGKTGEVQREAVVAIGKIGPAASAAVPMLIAKLNGSSDSHDKKDVVEALSNMGPAASPAVPTLVGMLTDSRRDTRDVYAALIKLGPNARSGLSKLQQLLSNESSFTRRSAFETILAIETSPAKLTTLAEKMIGDQDNEVSDMARKLMVKHPSTNADTMNKVIRVLTDSQYTTRLTSLQAVGSFGPKAAEALPTLIKENIGCSFSQPQKDLAFAAVKKIDPSGEKTIVIVRPALDDCFKVRGATELLEYIGSAKTKELAQTTRQRWKLK